MKTVIGNVARVALGCSLLIAAMGAAAPSTPKTSKSPTVNPHLHLSGNATPKPLTGNEPSTPAPKAPAAPKGTPRLALTTRSWAPRESMKQYAMAHTGTGTVRGLVVNATGLVAANVRLALRGPRGRVFPNVARRHITFSTANGTFEMTNVIPGAYRLVGGPGGKATAQITVHAGSIAQVTLRL